MEADRPKMNVGKTVIISPVKYPLKSVSPNRQKILVVAGKRLHSENRDKLSFQSSNTKDNVSQIGQKKVKSDNDVKLQVVESDSDQRCGSNKKSPSLWCEPGLMDPSCYKPRTTTPPIRIKRHHFNVCKYVNGHRVTSSDGSVDYDSTDHGTETVEAEVNKPSVQNDPALAASMRQVMQTKIKKMIGEEFSRNPSPVKTTAAIVAEKPKQDSSEVSGSVPTKSVTRNSLDSFCFLKQTASGRVVKRTELASMNSSDYFVDIPVPNRSKSVSNSKIQMPVVQELPKLEVKMEITENGNENNGVKGKSELSENSCVVNQNENNVISVNHSTLVGKNSGICCKQDVIMPITRIKLESPAVDDSELALDRDRIQNIKSEEANDAIPTTPETPDTESSHTRFLRVKLDHDYDERPPGVSPNFNNTPLEKCRRHWAEMFCANQRKDSVCPSDNDCHESIDPSEVKVSSISPVSTPLDPSTESVKPGKRNACKEDGGKKKKTRLISEVRTLIEESIKANKTMGVSPTSIIRRRRSMRNKKRTECEMLLDMLSESRGPEKLIRTSACSTLNLRSAGTLSKMVIANNPKMNKQLAPNQKVIVGINKVQEEKGKGKVCMEDATKKVVIQPKMKRCVTPLAAQKKKAILMTLNLEKKKKQKQQQKEVRFKDEVEESKNKKPIHLEDLKEKVKAKLERLPESTANSVYVCNDVKPTNSPFQIGLSSSVTSATTNGNFKRAPGRPRLCRVPQKPKPAKVSRHGRILGRPKKSSGSVQVPFSALSSVHMSPTRNPSVVGHGFVQRFPLYIFGSTAGTNNFILPTNVVDANTGLIMNNNPVLKHKDYSRQRSSQRQAESSYKYKEIAVKVHKDFSEIILISNTRPRNGLNPQVLRELKAALVTASNDESCRLVLFHGIGNMFCSGIDLRYLLKENKEQRQKSVAEMVTNIKEFVRVFAFFPKPLVAAVNGRAVGIGVGLLLLCDSVFASDKATFHLPYSRLGQVPEGCASYMLPKNLSMPVAGDLLFGDRTLTASEAAQYGLVSHVLWPSQFMEEVMPRVQHMATQSRHVMETSKALLRQRLKVDLETTLENECQLLVSQWCRPDCQKAMKEFVDEMEFV